MLIWMRSMSGHIRARLGLLNPVWIPRLLGMRHVKFLKERTPNNHVRKNIP